MNRRFLTVFALIFAPLLAGAQERVFKWVDEDGQVHYGDSIPVEYSELPKEVLNEDGIVVDNLDGKKTEEQKEAERLQSERMAALAERRRADEALLATYLTVEEILMHRDRRVQLFQAQSRVTELSLSNLGDRLDSLREEASRYQPYSEDPDAPMIPDDLAAHLKDTKDTIARHERNLEKYQSDEQRIIARFAGDISRFKTLKGIDQ